MIHPDEAVTDTDEKAERVRFVQRKEREPHSGDPRSRLRP